MSKIITKSTSASLTANSYSAQWWVLSNSLSAFDLHTSASPNVVNLRSLTGGGLIFDYNVTASRIYVSNSTPISTNELTSKSYVDSMSAAAISGSNSGATGYIPRFASGTTINNSLIFQYQNQIGIGTLTPGRTFTVFSNNATNIAIEGTESGGVHSIYLRPNVLGFNLISSNYNSGAVYLPLSISNRENTSDFVLTAGRVGIGTTTPNSLLHVYGGDLHVGDGNNYNPILQNAGSGRIPGSPGFSFFADTDTGMYNPNLGNTIAFSTGGTERLRIDSSGNIGIGTTAPTNKLHILGSSNDTITSTNLNVKFQSDGGNGFGFGTIASSPYTSYIQSGYVIDLGVATYSMSLNPLGGNVGIGTTSPSRKLTIQEATNTYMSFKPAATNSEFVVGSDAYGFIIYDQNATTYRLAISANNGAMGIGTNAPTATLQISNNISLNPLGVTNWGTTVVIADSNYPGIAFGSVASGIGALIREDSGILKFITGERGTGSWGGQERLSISSNGNVIIDTTTLFVDAAQDRVGIGTIIPETTLHVNGPISAGAMYNSISTISASVAHTVQASDYTLLCSASLSAITINLPPKVSNIGRILNIKRIDNTALSGVIINGYGNETIDGSITTGIFAQYGSITIQAQKDGWYII